MISTHRYRLPVRFWLQCIAVIGGLDAVIWLAAPEFVTSSAYDFARQVLPQHGWGAVFAASAALAAVGLADRIPERARFVATVAAFSLYGLACATVGLSIAVLTFEGQAGALSGATKWWLPFGISVRLLTRPSMEVDPE